MKNTLYNFETRWTPCPHEISTLQKQLENLPPADPSIDADSKKIERKTEIA